MRLRLHALFAGPLSPERVVFLLGLQPLDILRLLVSWMDLQIAGSGDAREARERQLNDEERRDSVP